MNELISVIMSTYNENERELREAVESILLQSYTNIEFLIVLDNPKNKTTTRVLNEYKALDQRIKLIFNLENMGLVSSLNKAIKKSNGSIIARMDADDISFPNRIEKQLKYMLQHKLDLVSTNKIIIDESGNKSLSKQKKLPTKKRRIYKLMEHINIINHPSVIFKKSVITNLGYYREIHSSEDYDLWLRMMSAGFTLGVLDEALIYYRIRQNSISRSNEFKQYLMGDYNRKLYKLRLKCFQDNFDEKNLNDFLRKKGFFDNKTEEQYYETNLYALSVLRNLKKGKLFSAISVQYFAYKKGVKLSNRIIEIIKLKYIMFFILGEAILIDRFLI